MVILNIHREHTMVKIKEIPLRLSLAILTRQDKKLGYLELKKKWDYLVQIHNEHPFNLDLPEEKLRLNGLHKNNEVRLITFRGSEMADEALIANIVWALDDSYYSNKLSRLRIIYAQREKDEPGDYFIFVEIWTDRGVLMSGAIDYSDNAAILLGIVKLLSITHETQIETVELPYEKVVESSNYFNNRHGDHLINIDE